MKLNGGQMPRIMKDIEKYMTISAFKELEEQYILNVGH